MLYDFSLLLRQRIPPFIFSVFISECVFGTIDGAVFENAPNGTLVASFNVTGEISSSTTTAAPGDIITLGLGPEFSKYFELDGKSLIVKDSAALDRSNIGEPTGTEIVLIQEDITCIAGGSTTVSMGAIGYILQSWVVLCSCSKVAVSIAKICLHDK